MQYEVATRCVGQCTPGGLAAIAQWRRTTGYGSAGCYNCRNVRGGSSLSVHSEGRAVDLSCNAFNATARARGDAYARWLIAHHESLQCQAIIWNRRRWRFDRGWAAYTGLVPHTDHLHVELTRQGGAYPSSLWGTDWRTGAIQVIDAFNPPEASDVTPEEHNKLNEAVLYAAAAARDSAATSDRLVRFVAATESRFAGAEAREVQRWERLFAALERLAP